MCVCVCVCVCVSDCECSNPCHRFCLLSTGQVQWSDFARDDHVVLEISMQDARGVFCSRHVRLLRTLPPPVWEYPFPPPTTSAATVTVDRTVSTPFPPHLLSANSQFAGNQWGLGYGAPQVAELLRWLHLPQLRFPGGTVGNFYNWRTDAFYPNNPCGNHAADHPGFSFAFQGYVEAMAATNASSVLMFNVIEDSPAESAARLMNRSRAGLHIDWIELGNENYGRAQNCGHLNPSNETGQPDPRTYIAFTSQVADALRTSGAPHIPPLAAPLDAHDWTAGGWNEQLVNQSVYDG